MSVKGIAPIEFGVPMISMGTWVYMGEGGWSFYDRDAACDAALSAMLLYIYIYIRRCRIYGQ